MTSWNAINQNYINSASETRRDLGHLVCGERHQYRSSPAAISCELAHRHLSCFLSRPYIIVAPSPFQITSNHHLDLCKDIVQNIIVKRNVMRWPEECKISKPAAAVSPKLNESRQFPQLDVRQPHFRLIGPHWSSILSFFYRNPRVYRLFIRSIYRKGGKDEGRWWENPDVIRQPREWPDEMVSCKCQDWLNFGHP